MTNNLETKNEFVMLQSGYFLQTQFAHEFSLVVGKPSGDSDLELEYLQFIINLRDPPLCSNKRSLYRN